MRRVAGLGVFVAVAGIVMAACGTGSSDGETGNAAESQVDADLQAQYLAEVTVADADAFASEEAALLYLRNYCQTEVTTDHGAQDAIDDIVASYCDTELAAQLGVEAPPRCRRIHRLTWRRSPRKRGPGGA